jgi:hypothetical protein
MSSKRIPIDLSRAERQASTHRSTKRISKHAPSNANRSTPSSTIVKTAIIIATMLGIGLIISRAPLQELVSYLSIPNSAYNVSKPFIDGLSALGATKICDHGFNGRGNPDSLVPYYVAYYHIHRGDHFEEKIIEASAKAGYKVSKEKGAFYPTVGEIPGSDFFTNVTPEQQDKGNLVDTFDVWIIHSDQQVRPECGGYPTKATDDEPIIKMDVTLWGHEAI